MGLKHSSTFFIGDVFVDTKRQGKKLKKYRAMKFDGDDTLSWAVFYSKDVKGYRSPVYSSMGVTPIVSGCSQTEARHYIKQLEKKDGEKTV